SAAGAGAARSLSRAAGPVRGGLLPLHAHRRSPVQEPPRGGGRLSHQSGDANAGPRRCHHFRTAIWLVKVTAHPEMPRPFGLSETTSSSKASQSLPVSECVRVARSTMV